MILRHYWVLWIGTILIGLIIGGCTSGNLTPVITVLPTQSEASDDQPIEKTKAPEPTAAHTSTPTMLPHTTVEAGDLKGVKITFWHPWDEETSSQMETLVKKFNRTNSWGIKVTAQSFYSAGALYEKIMAAQDDDASELPDILAATSDQLVEWYAENALLIPLDDYITHPSFGMDATLYDSYRPTYLDQDRLDEKQYAMPLLRNAYVLFYNQTWANELGFTKAPRTPAEFKTQACAAAVENNSKFSLEVNGTGGWVIDTGAMTLISWLQSFEGDVVSSTGGYTFESPEAEDTLLFLRDMMDHGCAWVSRNQTIHEYFVSRRALFYSGTLQDLAIQQRIQEIAKSGDEWTVLGYPRENGSSFAYASGYSLAIVDPKNKDAANNKYVQQMAGWVFINWLSQNENQSIMAETMHSLPVQTVPGDLYTRDEFPWGNVSSISEISIPAPVSPSWRIVRRLVEDANWQVFHTATDQVDTILPELDKAVKELLQER